MLRQIAHNQAGGKRDQFPAIILQAVGDLAQGFADVSGARELARLAGSGTISAMLKQVVEHHQFHHQNIKEMYKTGVR
jgi:hypothetical protein